MYRPLFMGNHLPLTLKTTYNEKPVTPTVHYVGLPPCSLVTASQVPLPILPYSQLPINRVGDKIHAPETY